VTRSGCALPFALPQGDCIPPHVDHFDFVRPFCTVSLLSTQCIMFAQASAQHWRLALVGFARTAKCLGRWCGMRRACTSKCATVTPNKQPTVASILLAAAEAGTGGAGRVCGARGLQPCQHPAASRWAWRCHLACFLIFGGMGGCRPPENVWLSQRQPHQAAAGHAALPAHCLLPTFHV